MASWPVQLASSSGGQDQQVYTYVEQSDIDEAASALESSLMPGAQAALQQQIQAHEQLVSASHCLPDTNLRSE